MTLPSNPTSSATPTRMRGLGLTARPEPGGTAEALRWVEVPRPVPARGEVRVRVMAAALNRDDVHAAEGTVFGGIPVAPRPTPQRPRVIGMELAGVVDALGPGATGPAVGTRVFGVVYGWTRAGSLAPWCCTKASRLVPLPEGWSFAEGAALAFSGSVAAMALQASGGVEGRRCLVVGASGNIGRLLVRGLVAAGAGQVAAVCSGAKAESVRALGAQRVVDYRAGPWGPALKEEGLAFERVFDCVGGRAIESQARSVLRSDGHLLTLCGPLRFLGGERLPWLRIGWALGYIGWRMLTSRMRGPRYTLLSGAEPDWDALRRWFLERDIRPKIERRCALEPAEVAAAIGGLHHSVGKLVVEPGPIPAISRRR